jgi:dipeptidyl aminopeptidase/acylaminoacyl peptidase
LSVDGGTLYYRHPVRPGQPQDLIARDVSSGRELVLVKQRQIGPVHLSPDGRFIATSTLNAAAKMMTLLLVSSDGSGSRELAPGLDVTVMTWSPDSRSLIAKKNIPMRIPEREYWWIPIDGREPRRIDLPDTGRLAEAPTAGGQWMSWTERDPGFGGAPDEQSQIWVLENFLPRPGGGGAGGGSRR